MSVGDQRKVLQSIQRALFPNRSRAEPFSAGTTRKRMGATAAASLILLSIIVVSTATGVVAGSTSSSLSGLLDSTWYKSRSAMMSAWYALQAKYSTLVSSEVFGKTSGGRNMVAFLIGNRSASGRFMLDGASHGFETLGSEISYYYIKWLLQKREPAYTSLLNKILIIVVPITNVDEYAIAKKDINGVDLNRNFDWHWSWTATTGGGVSSNPSSPNYRGPYPLSESEDRAMKRLWAQYKPKNYINLHQGGSPIIWHADTEYNTNTAQRLADNRYFSQTIAKYRQLAQQRGVSSYSVYVDGGTGNFGNSPYYYDHTYSWSCELWAWPTPTYSKVPTILGDWLPLLLTLCQQSV